MLGPAAAILFPRVARLARRLHEARTIDEEVDAAYDLLRIDSEPARDVIADHAARSPLRAFDRKHRVLVIVDGSTGENHEVVTARPAGGSSWSPGRLRTWPASWRRR